MQTVLNTWVWKSYLQTFCPWDNPQTKHTQLLYFIVASQLWEMQIHSAVQQT